MLTDYKMGLKDEPTAHFLSIYSVLCIGWHDYTEIISKNIISNWVKFSSHNFLV